MWHSIFLKKNYIDAYIYLCMAYHNDERRTVHGDGSHEANTSDERFPVAVVVKYHG